MNSAARTPQPPSPAASVLAGVETVLPHGGDVKLGSRSEPGLTRALACIPGLLLVGAGGGGAGGGRQAAERSVGGR